MQLPETGYYLGFCEGVVGRFAIADVQVHGKLKRAVMARRPASGASSPTGSPIAHSVSPTPSIPHTTYSPIRHPIDLLVTNARAENSLTGVSSLLASAPISEPVLPNPGPETGSAPPKLISSSPPSSPLRVNTTTATTTSHRESLNSLASTEASLLSGSSVYSFRRPSNGNDEGDRGGDLDETPEEITGEDGEKDQLVERDDVLSPPSPNTSNSRASSLSVGGPFHHDDPEGTPPASSPFTPNHEDPNEDEEAGPNEETDQRVSVHFDLRDSLHHGDASSWVHPGAVDTASTAERRNIVSAALSDGEVGIGLTLLGGLLGAGRGSISGDSGADDGDEGSESDCGHEEGYGLRTGAEPADYGDDDASLYRDDSFEDSRDADRPGSLKLMDGQGDGAPLEHDSAAPILNGHGRLSRGSTESRSSTPPFGFELEPTTVNFGSELRGEVVGGAGGASVDETQPVPITDAPADEPGSTPTPTTQNDASSDDESDYGQPEAHNPGSPISFVSRQRSVAPGSDDDDPILPPVRPPYHRSSASMRSIASSDGGGYYDDGIYDHYRYSHVSMAARSVRFSIIGAGGDMPPLPGAGERERVAPLNLQQSKPGVGSTPGSLASPGSQGPMSPASQGPGSPSLHGPRSPLAQGEPASPRSMGSGISPLAGPILQAQVEEKLEVEASQPEPPAATPATPATPATGLAPIATSGLAPSSPGTLTIPLSPTPSAPPSPALSANLASSLRQAIEQQRQENAEPAPPGPELQDDAQSIGENKPVLASPITLQSTFGGSQIASLQRRPSQFAPHPNAPRPVHHFTAAVTPSGPPESTTGQQAGVPHMKLHDALQLVLQRLRTGGVPTPTIHGRTHSELALSYGPVPISFLFDPDGRGVPGTSVPARIIGAQRSASLNVNTVGGPSGNGAGRGRVGSKIRPRSRSFSGAPQEQISTLRSAGEPSTPTLQTEAKSLVTATPAASSPLAQPPAPESPTTPVLAPTAPDTPTRTSESPTRSPTLPGNSSPVKRVASPPTNAVPSSSTKGPFRGLRHVASNTMMRVGLGSISIPSSPVPKDNQVAESPLPRQRQSNDVPRPTDTIDAHTPSSASISASPMASSNLSLHSKVSSTGLRIARANAAAMDTPTTPLSPVGSVQLAEETVHFHDMDFDMVKPKRRVSVVRASEDGGYPASRKSHQSDRPNGQPKEDSRTPTPTSPTTASPSHQTRGSVPASVVPLSSGHNSLTSPAEIAAHISREQRWISTMQTIPSSSIRKNKKIKKLLLEGVPASVRGVVWLYLTDSKARRMVGLYSQLGKRGRVPATPEILKDLDFIQRAAGLCRIAGNLLMHSPEEDAFWTFVALMDNYLRGYCAVNSLQMEADSAFFAKSLESNDPQLAAKLFRELGLGAVDFCKPCSRILSAFVAAVPHEYECRIWDIFLFEGAPFLFRVALALLGYLKKQIMALTTKSSPGALAYLLSVSPQCLPSDPDQLIAAAYSVKFKDDDMRKMRPKIEAQLRKGSGLNRSMPARDVLKK
ncbi:hypothetical protein FRC10_001622 [Ceratobasidium sp. 414]|nr:hypothetical protein FRC10_001622 [Ceratobasidium sp. 414]